MIYLIDRFRIYFENITCCFVIAHGVLEIQIEGPTTPIQTTRRSIVPKWGELMLSKSTGIKKSVKGNWFFLKCGYL